MPQTATRPHDRMPPAINIIAIATFAASLSARALDPVLPHVADEFSISITTAASFAAVFAFTFAVVQPVFATRILAGIGSGGVFPVALSLTSDLVGPEKRQVAIGRTLAGSMTGN